MTFMITVSAHRAYTEKKREGGLEVHSDFEQVAHCATDFTAVDE